MQCALNAEVSINSAGSWSHQGQLVCIGRNGQCASPGGGGLLHKHVLADALTLYRYKLSLLQHGIDTVAQLSVTVNVCCTYLVLYLPGLHVNISIQGCPGHKKLLWQPLLALGARLVGGVALTHQHKL